MKIKYILPVIFLFLSTAAFASYEEALELFMEEKYDESLKMIADELDISRDLEPGAPNYKQRYLAAHDHWKLGNTGSAIAHFKRCMDIEKQNPDPLIDLSLLMLDQKKYGDARYFARKAVELVESSIPYYVLGNVSLAQRNYWRAKEYFEKAVSLDPGLHIAYNGLGMTLMNLKKYSEANTAFSAALAISPDSSEILNNTAMSLQKMGNLNEAYGYFSSAIAKDPDNPVLKKNMERIKRLIEENKSH